MVKILSVEELNEQLQLKPRFKVEVNDANIQKRFSAEKNHQSISNVIIKCLDEHVWLSIPPIEKRYYSPRLHVEIEQRERQCILHCTFGPDPNLWTMFMFVHFFLGLAFIGVLTLYYTNTTLGNSNILAYSLMLTIALLWVALYVFARNNRQKAAPQSKMLLKVLTKIIS
ncbi:hypothetical protein [Psychroflexus sp. ALD_RP9]|uniref:hypothetical protein n=1 Tax=Psychroflexus sp. ALD_RP9 TaxID=2777186 RepID=UPI001A8EAD75|nr:hypothetical protein [Psychroflexus sp. ALD_RP9]QSS97681.1 hypothetical protein IMZ30_02935 [Psychroflexus sp. ALD_RP9]